MSASAREDLIQEENRRLRRMRFLVDLTLSVLYQDPRLTLGEARQMVRRTERAVLGMFPDKEFTFHLLLMPRFERVLRERWGKGMEPTIH